jgi:hypothetical protein
MRGNRVVRASNHFRLVCLILPLGRSLYENVVRGWNLAVFPFVAIGIRHGVSICDLKTLQVVASWR